MSKISIISQNIFLGTSFVGFTKLLVYLETINLCIKGLGLRDHTPDKELKY